MHPKIPRAVYIPGNLPVIEERVCKARLKQSNQQPDNPHKQNLKQIERKTYKEIENDQESLNGSFAKNFRSVAEMQRAFK